MYSCGLRYHLSGDELQTFTWIPILYSSSQLSNGIFTTYQNWNHFHLSPAPTTPSQNQTKPKQTKQKSQASYDKCLMAVPSTSSQKLEIFILFSSPTIPTSTCHQLMSHLSTLASVFDLLEFLNITCLSLQ